MTVEVVVVNWNAGQQLLECVESVLSYGQDLVSSIVVVDNGSTDGSAALVDRLPKVRLVHSGSNLGFAKACNLGAAGIESEFILFLNPDARVYASTLERAHAFMERTENSCVGICGVQLVDEEGHISRSCSRFPTVANVVSRATGLDRVSPDCGQAMAEWAHTETRYVDQVIGAFFLVRSALFKELNGFDERFFVYFEEVDFSFRAAQKGWKSAYLADCQAFHAGGGTSYQVKAKRLFYSLRSRILYAYKHFGFVRAGAVLAATLCIEPVSRMVFGLAKGTAGSVSETGSAYAMLLRWLPQWWLKGTTR